MPDPGGQISATETIIAEITRSKTVRFAIIVFFIVLTVSDAKLRCPRLCGPTGKSRMN